MPDRAAEVGAEVPWWEGPSVTDQSQAELIDVPDQPADDHLGPE